MDLSDRLGRQNKVSDSRYDNQENRLGAWGRGICLDIFTGANSPGKNEHGSMR